MHSNSPSRSSTPENDGPVAVDELRAPSLNHVTNNAIASAAMRELLEMMVTPHDGQLRFHSSDTKCGLHLLYGVRLLDVYYTTHALLYPSLLTQYGGLRHHIQLFGFSREPLSFTRPPTLALSSVVLCPTEVCLILTVIIRTVLTCYVACSSRTALIRYSLI